MTPIALSGAETPKQGCEATGALDQPDFHLVRIREALPEHNAYTSCCCDEHENSRAGTCCTLHSHPPAYWRSAQGCRVRSAVAGKVSPAATPKGKQGVASYPTKWQVSHGLQESSTGFETELWRSRTATFATERHCTARGMCPPGKHHAYGGHMKHQWQERATSLTRSFFTTRRSSISLSSNDEARTSCSCRAARVFARSACSRGTAAAASRRGAASAAASDRPLAYSEA